VIFLRSIITSPWCSSPDPSDLSVTEPVITIMWPKNTTDTTPRHFSEVSDVLRRLLSSHEYCCSRSEPGVEIGSFPTIISAGKLALSPPVAKRIRTQCGHELILQSCDSV
jgi:hypothetical protein